MSFKRDYYEILGVGKNASSEDIKAAFRKLALEYHPDRNKNKNAEIRFKEINEAYQVLNDKAKRDSYDRFGHDGVKVNVSDFDFSNLGGFGDIFDAFFGGTQSSQSSNRRTKGRDLHMRVDINFEESAFGVEKKIYVERIGKCVGCQGTGAEGMENLVNCSSCSGSGQIKRVQRTIFGQFSQSAVCSDCSGIGKTIKKKCKKCNGRGALLEKKDVLVNIPTGISDGDIIKLSEEGEFGGQNSRNGDIKLEIHVKNHEYFIRRGRDVYLTLELNVVEVMLGSNIEVPTLDGITKIKIPEGTQSGDVIKLNNKGFSSVGGNSTRGTQMNVIKVLIPKNLSSQEKDKMKEFKDLLDSNKNSKNRSIFSKFRRGV